MAAAHPRRKRTKTGDPVASPNTGPPQVVHAGAQKRQKSLF